MTSLPPHVLIFTDLDGTFLDHENYSPEPAASYIRQLDPALVTLIPVTSKTRAETAAFLQSLEMTCPYVTENGSIIHAPAGLPWRDAAEKMYRVLGVTHEKISEFLDQLPSDLRQLITGFSDMSEADIVAATGLSRGGAAQAKQREATEPFLWSGSRQEMSELLSRVRKAGLVIQQGGRFHHFTASCGKADAMRWMINDHRAAQPDRQLITIALGDGPNDLAMIEQADHGVIIPNPAGKEISSDQDSVTLARAPGPEGWVDAVERILAGLGLDQAPSSPFPPASQDDR